MTVERCGLEIASISVLKESLISDLRCFSHNNRLSQPASSEGKAKSSWWVHGCCEREVFPTGCKVSLSDFLPFCPGGPSHVLPCCMIYTCR